MNAIQTVKASELTPAEIMEKVLLSGDLARLTPDERVQYYARTCESVGLNPLTRPLEYISLNGKLTLYARKDATDQLRASRQVSIVIVAREVVEGCYVVTARATLPSGRTDESVGACPIEGLKGEARANCLMKTETKAKRRVTLSICGMGMLDESEVDSIPGAKIGESSAPVIAEAKTYGKPKLIETLPPLEDLVASAQAKPSSIAEVVDYEPSTLEQQTALAVKFRDALPEKFRSHADQIRRTALAEAGWVDAEGVGTSKAIPRKEFPAVAKRLISAASRMTEPFLANDDDMPSNI